eukprot:1386638-Amphidinium_carterae.1
MKRNPHRSRREMSRTNGNFAVMTLRDSTPSQIGCLAPFGPIPVCLATSILTWSSLAFVVSLQVKYYH